jgi:hypothetical protein
VRDVALLLEEHRIVDCERRPDTDALHEQNRHPRPGLAVRRDREHAQHALARDERHRNELVRVDARGHGAAAPDDVTGEGLDGAGFDRDRAVRAARLREELHAVALEEVQRRHGCTLARESGDESLRALGRPGPADEHVAEEGEERHVLRRRVRRGPELRSLECEPALLGDRDDDRKPRLVEPVRLRRREREHAHDRRARRAQRNGDERLGSESRSADGRVRICLDLLRAPELDDLAGPHCLRRRSGGVLVPVPGEPLGVLRRDARLADDLQVVAVDDLDPGDVHADLLETHERRTHHLARVARACQPRDVALEQLRPDTRLLLLLVGERALQRLSALARQRLQHPLVLGVERPGVVERDVDHAEDGAGRRDQGSGCGGAVAQVSGIAELAERGVLVERVGDGADEHRLAVLRRPRDRPVDRAGER